MREIQYFDTELTVEEYIRKEKSAGCLESRGAIHTARLTADAKAAPTAARRIHFCLFPIQDSLLNLSALRDSYRCGVSRKAFPALSS